MKTLNESFNRISKCCDSIVKGQLKIDSPTEIGTLGEPLQGMFAGCIGDFIVSKGVKPLVNTFNKEKYVICASMSALREPLCVVTSDQIHKCW